MVRLQNDKVEAIKAALTTLAVFLCADARSKFMVGDYVSGVIEAALAMIILYFIYIVNANRAVQRVLELVRGEG